MASCLGLLSSVRHFSTSGAFRAGLIKPPISVFGIGGRYANALYSAASKKKQLNAVENELKSFQDLVNTNQKIKDFIVDPTLKKSIKQDVLLEILKKMKCNEVTIKFLESVSENRRLGHLSSICNSFYQIMSAHRGEVNCEVTTAKPLDANQMKDLEGSLNAFLNKGETLKLSTKIDPNIIGGMVVSIGDKYIDMSMSSKITKYTNLIKSA